ncbi:MAG: hypothetical protein QM632_00845 [Micrococcaceae bacterium]
MGKICALYLQGQDSTDEYKLKLGFGIENAVDPMSAEQLLVYSTASWTQLAEAAKKKNIHHILAQRLLQKKQTLFAGTAGNILFTSLGDSTATVNHGIAASNAEEFWFTEEKADNLAGLDEWHGQIGTFNTTHTLVQQQEWYFCGTKSQVPITWDFEQTTELMTPPRTLFNDDKSALVAVDNGYLAAIVADLNKTVFAQNLARRYFEQGEML